MNCVCPKAPAHEPVSPCACRSPRSIRVSSASSSPRKGLAAAGTGQRGQRLQQRALAEHAAIVALYAPDGDDGGGIDTVLRRYPIEQIAVLPQLEASILDALAIDQRGQVVPDRCGEFRLRIEQAEHAGVRGEAGGDSVESVDADALGCGAGLDTRQAATESGITIGSRCRRRRRCRGERGHQAERGQDGHGVLRVAVARPS